METVRHLYLDLEDTLIEPVVNGWPNVNLIPHKIAEVRKFIEAWKPQHVHIFSFAVWNESEHMRFCLYQKERLEQVLGVKFTTVPTVDDDIIPQACRVLSIDPGMVNFSDASDFWGKGESFRLFMKSTWHDLEKQGRGVEVILIDDAVTNEVFQFPDLHIKGQLLNIDSKLWHNLSAPE